MRNLFVFTVFFVTLALINGDGDKTDNIPSAPNKCTLIYHQEDKDKEWKTMNKNTDCSRLMREQVKEELKAAVTYLAMGSHFLQDTVNRPGFAKFFLDSASEERQHALKFLDYLLMRGELTTNDEFKNLITYETPDETEWSSGVDAMKAALALETRVTKKIRDIIVTCEGQSTNTENKNAKNKKTTTTQQNDYHVVDWLTGDLLDEQYKGQRDLAGKIATLSKMKEKHGELGEFLYDKTL